MKKEKIDFGGVDPNIGARSRHIPPGDYMGKITKVQKRWKDDDHSNIPYFSWQITVTNGSNKGVPLYTNTSMKPDSLWNLRNLIFAATGKNVAGKVVSFDPESIIGKNVAITVDDSTYENKLRSAIVDVRPADQLEADDEDEDEEAEEEEEEDEDLEDVDVEDL